MAGRSALGLGGGGEGMVVVGFGSRVGDRMTATGSRPEDDGERERASELFQARQDCCSQTVIIRVSIRQGPMI